MKWQRPDRASGFYVTRKYPTHPCFYFFINVYTRIYIQTRAFLHVCMPLAFTLYSISPVDNTFLLTESDIRCDRMVKRWSCLHEDFCFSCCFWEYILAHLEHKSANIFSFLLIRTERRRVSPCSLIVKARSEIFFLVSRRRNMWEAVSER